MTRQASEARASRGEEREEEDKRASEASEATEGSRPDSFSTAQERGSGGRGKKDLECKEEVITPAIRGASIRREKSAVEE